MDSKELQKIGSLTALSPAEKDYDLLAGMITQMLTLFDQLQSVETDAAPDVAAEGSLEPRKDVVVNDPVVHEILSRFPENEDRYVVLPAVL